MIKIQLICFKNKIKIYLKEQKYLIQMKMIKNKIFFKIKQIIINSIILNCLTIKMNKTIFSNNN